MSALPGGAPTWPATAASTPFWDGCARRELLLPRCTDCATTFFPPREACPGCGSDAPDWRPATGRGRVWSLTRVHVSFFGADWEPPLPYDVVLVDLDEGVRMLSRLTPDSDEVGIGDEVVVRFVEAGARLLPFFAAASAAPE